METRWVYLIDIIQIGILLVPSTIFFVWLYGCKNAFEFLALLMASIIYIWAIMLVSGILQLVKFLLRFRKGKHYG